jgi:hypothetical protein
MVFFRHQHDASTFLRRQAALRIVRLWLAGVGVQVRLGNPTAGAAISRYLRMI